MASTPTATSYHPVAAGESKDYVINYGDESKNDTVEMNETNNPNKTVKQSPSKPLLSSQQQESSNSDPGAGPFAGNTMTSTNNNAQTVACRSMTNFMDPYIPDFLENEKFYTKNWLLLIPLISSILIVGLYNRSWLLKSEFISYLTIVIVSIIFCTYLLLIICALTIPVPSLKFIEYVVNKFKTLTCIFSCNDDDKNDQIPSSPISSRRDYEFIMNNGNCFSRLKLLPAFINHVFNPDYDDTHEELKIFLFDSEKSLLLLGIVLILYGSIVFLINAIYLIDYNFGQKCTNILYDDDLSISDIKSKYDSKEINGCALSNSSFGPTYAFVVCFASLAFFFKHTKDCQDQIVSRKNDLLNNNQYKDILSGSPIHGHKGIDNIIQKVLDTWNMKRFSMKYDWIWCILLMIACFGLHFGFAAFRIDIFNHKKYDNVTIIICCILYTLDSFFLTAVILIVGIRGVRHFEFPYVIMHAMTLDFDELLINSNSIIAIEKYKSNDLIGWWLFRRYYIWSIIHHYVNSFSNGVIVAFLGSVITAIFSIEALINDKDENAYLFLFWTCVIISFTFHLCTNAYNYLQTQKSHITMLKRLRIALINQMHMQQNNIYFGNKHNKQNKASAISGVPSSSSNSNNTGDAVQILTNTLDQIENEMKDNMYCMKAFGFKIDDGFMVALKAAISTFVLGVTVNLLSA